MKIISRYLLLLTLTFIIPASLVDAWTGPTQAPPNGNVSAPLNTSLTAQTKEGPLTINRSSSSVDGLTVLGVVKILTPTLAKLLVASDSTVAPIFSIHVLGNNHNTWGKPSIGFGTASVFSYIMGPNSLGGNTFDLVRKDASADFRIARSNLTTGGTFKTDLAIDANGNMTLGPNSFSIRTNNTGNAELAVDSGKNMYLSPNTLSVVTNAIKVTTGTPGVGKVLTSADTLGNATWMPISPASGNTNFGGIYMADLNNDASMSFRQCRYPNPLGNPAVRGGCSCPAGYTEFKFWDWRSPGDHYYDVGGAVGVEGMWQCIKL